LGAEVRVKVRVAAGTEAVRVSEATKMEKVVG
jgi:hypothetical protein